MNTAHNQQAPGVPIPWHQDYAFLLLQWLIIGSMLGATRWFLVDALDAMGVSTAWLVEALAISVVCWLALAGGYVGGAVARGITRLIRDEVRARRAT